MYLSQLNLNPVNRGVQRDLGDCNQLHRTILRAFPALPDGRGASGANHGAREQLGVLFREEPEGRDRSVKVLVQSRVKPNWTTLELEYLMPTRAVPAGYRTTSMDRLFEVIRRGEPFVFRLRANPTKRIHRHTNPDTGKVWDGKRVNLQREDDWLAWIERKGHGGGFELLTVQAAPATAERPDIFDTRAGKGPRIVSRSRKLTFGSVLFEGRLRVTDADVFRETLARGIGSGKAYGFGLLSIARAG